MLAQDLLAPIGAKLCKLSLISSGLGFFIKLLLWFFLCRFFFLWWLLFSSLLGSQSSSLSPLSSFVCLEFLCRGFLVHSQQHWVGLEMQVEVFLG